jgi:hypothetical protein
VRAGYARRQASLYPPPRSGPAAELFSRKTICKAGGSFRSFPGIAVFVGDKADKDHWVKVGRSFQRFALQANALSLRHAHINQPVEDVKIRSQFASLLGEPDKRPDLVLRFGYAPVMPMSLRRAVTDVLIPWDIRRRHVDG